MSIKKIQALNKPQALVVNSSLTITRMLEMRLSDYGVLVEFAESAATAIMLLEKKSYDIVFLGGILVDTEGYVVCKAIKETPSRRHMLVIIITSKPSQFDKVKAALAGCDAYLVHPISDAVFRSILSRHLAF
jgi:twitching motility two-component system response regulator PilG